MGVVGLANLYQLLGLSGLSSVTPLPPGTLGSWLLLPQVLNEDRYSSTIKDKILTIDVRPGWRQGTRITFEKEGDQVRG